MIKYLRCRLSDVISLRPIMEYPLVFLVVLFALLLLYNLTNLCASASGIAETDYSGNVIQSVNNNIAVDSLYTLKKKMEIIYGRGVVQERLLWLTEVPAISLFDVMLGGRETVMYIAEESPPEVRIRAVAVSGEDKIALMDIGDIKGRLVREHDLFGAGLGIVRRISSEGVVWNWNAQEFCALLHE